MSSAERAAALRAEAAALDVLAEAENAAAEAKAAYAADRSESNKAAHQSAQATLRETRQAQRGLNAPDGIGVTIYPATIAGSAAVQPPAVEG